MGAEKEYFGVPCAFHPQEIITNFCKSLACLLPLCPKCIRLHVDEHRNSESFAQVESIDLSLQEISDDLNSMARMINKSGEELIDIQSQKERLKQHVLDRFQEAKTRLTNEFQRSIQKLQRHINQQIHEFDERIMLDLQEVDDRLRTLLGKVWRSLQELSSDRCLRTLILYHSSDLQPEIEMENNELHDRVECIRERNFSLLLDESEMGQLKSAINGYAKCVTNEPSYLDKMFNLDRTLRGASRFMENHVEDLY